MMSWAETARRPFPIREASVGPRNSGASGEWNSCTITPALKPPSHFFKTLVLSWEQVSFLEGKAPREGLGLAGDG